MAELNKQQTILFTQPEQEKLNKIKQYIEDNKQFIKTTTGKTLVFYYDEESCEIKIRKDTKFTGVAVIYDFNDVKEGNFENEKLSEYNVLCDKSEIKIFEGVFQNYLPQKGTFYDENGKKIKEGWFENYALNGLAKRYCSTTIQTGIFKDDYLYLGSSYFKNDNENKTVGGCDIKEIDEHEIIYTLKRDETNQDIRTLIFYTTNSKIGLTRDIQIHIDENNIVTLQTIDGEPTELTEEEINKIRQFFINISKENLFNFDPHLALLYCTLIINKQEYQDMNVLIADAHTIDTKTTSEYLEETLKVITNIPPDQRKGKFVIVCDWLQVYHRVNLIIDFDNNVFEIINTASNSLGVYNYVLFNLPEKLNNQFGNIDWVVYENNTTYQSNGNCYIASNIVSTEKMIIEKIIDEYNKKEEELKQGSERLNVLESLQQQKLLNLIINGNENIETTTIQEFETYVNSFLNQYNTEIERIIMNELLYQNLINDIKKPENIQENADEKVETLDKSLQQKNIEDKISKIKEDVKTLKMKKENFVRLILLLRERLFNKCKQQFDIDLSNNAIIHKGVGIRFGQEEATEEDIKRSLGYYWF